MERLGFKDLFDDIFASADLGCVKSEQEFWQIAWERLGRPEKSKVMVWDDSEGDVASAKLFGFRAELYVGFDSYARRMESL